MTLPPDVRPLHPVADHDRRITLFAEVGRVRRTCSVGITHVVSVLAHKRVRQVGVWTHDNGYERNECAVYVDAQGRIYRQHISIDYHNSTSYGRDDGVSFESWPGYRPKPSILATEVTAEEWAEHAEIVRQATEQARFHVRRALVGR